ncbi:hypothetical protein [Actinomadura sp. 21ATH]|uniref:hypothetical protein n=1 Tax=Actinomadura sp. 21ATH TaxID=1735444 RepID=UPI0035C1C7F6
MTTDPHDEHGEILRRALQAEAESVIPAADGLERIRARIDERSQRRFGRDWLLGFTGGGSGAVWARPVLAVAAAVLIAGIGVTAPQTLDLIQSVGSNGTSGDGQHNGTGGSVPGTGGLPPDARQPAPSEASRGGAPADSGSPSPDTSIGSTACATAPATGSPAVSASPGAGSASAGGTGAAPCPSGSPSTSPTPTPSDTGTGQTEQPTTPTEPPASDPPAPAKAEEPAA